MTHHIYHTDAIILEGKHSRDANKYFTLFTREVGLVRATAQGVRRIDSKLRYALQEFAEVRADLVKGREVWRITSATPVRSFFTKGFLSSPSTSSGRSAIANVANLASLLLPPEVPHAEIFEILFSFFTDVSNNVFSKSEIEHKEVAVVVGMLVALGYLPESARALPLRDAVRVINQSLRDTQLM